ncbi:MAG TPA: hypothetical protein VIH91_11260 [Terriglobales bacterium]
MRRTTYWPGSAGLSGRPSAGSNTSDKTLLLSRVIRETRRRRKPGHAGGGSLDELNPKVPFAGFFF